MNMNTSPFCLSTDQRNLLYIRQK